MRITWKKTLRTIFILALLSCNVGCDQISKHIVRQTIAEDANISIIPGHFILTNIENTGAFLSVGQNLPEPLKTLLLTIFPLTVLILALVFLFTHANLSRMSVLGICFVVGGGLGNIYDRLVYGSVTDFVHLNFGIFQTGVFNMADVSVMVGFGLVLLESIQRNRAATIKDNL